MENKGEIPEKNKESLQSEILENGRKAIKTKIVHFTETPELQHFAMVKVSKNDNVYGVKWGNVVKKYLLTAYSGKEELAEVVLDGITYKILKRRGVTAFYDADGNTLFDVENNRLAREYEYVMQEDKAEERSGNDAAVCVIASPDPAAIKKMAKEKLEKERKADKEKTFAEPIIGFLLKRCEEDLGLAEDVVQEHKTWKKCFDYIYGQARKQTKGNCVAVRDEVVYEWAEDYYHKDDKAEEERKAKKEAEARAKRKEPEAEKKADAKQSLDKTQDADKCIPAKKEKTKEHKKKNNKEMEGQLDMFSLMGM